MNATNRLLKIEEYNLSFAASIIVLLEHSNPINNQNNTQNNHNTQCDTSSQVEVPTEVSLLDFEEEKSLIMNQSLTNPSIHLLNHLGMYPFTQGIIRFNDNNESNDINNDNNEEKLQQSQSLVIGMNENENENENENDNINDNINDNFNESNNNNNNNSMKFKRLIDKNKNSIIFDNNIDELSVLQAYEGTIQGQAGWYVLQDLLFYFIKEKVSYIHSFIHYLFIHSFIQSFIHLFIFYLL